MIKDDVLNYAKLTLAGKDLDTVLDEDFRNSVLKFLTKQKYTDAEIVKVQHFMSELVLTLKETGIKKMSLQDFNDFFDSYTGNNSDQSKHYIPGINRGKTVFNHEFNHEPMFENEDFKIIDMGMLSYDNNQEYVHKYKIVRFAKGDRPAITFECYSNIDAILLADDKDYRELVDRSLNKFNIRRINCNGYIGEFTKDKETDKYKVSFDKLALSAVMDFENEQKKGNER